MEKPEITLKNIKYFEAGSQETYCFTATIYVNGKKWGHVRNDGQGGSNMVDGVTNDEFRQLNRLISQTYPKMEYDFTEVKIDADLETVCSDLMHEYLLKRDFQKILRRISYVRQNSRGIWQMPAKYKPNAALIEDIKNRAPWAKDVIFFADLSKDEGFELFKQNI